MNKKLRETILMLIFKEFISKALSYSKTFTHIICLNFIEFKENKLKKFTTSRLGSSDGSFPRKFKQTIILEK